MKKSWITAVAAGVAAVVTAILVPSVAIGAFALRTSDTHEITHFALAVAEPLALLGALAVSTCVARFTARKHRRPAMHGAFVGVASAAFIVGAAFWTGDVDRWTAAAAVLLPIGGIVGGWRASLRAAPTNRPAELPAPDPTPHQAAAWNRNSSVRS